MKKESWTHSFCVAKQREMGVLFNARRNISPFIEADKEYIMLINDKITYANVTLKSKSMKSGENIIPEEVIMSKIILIRGQKVMISSDLADLYGITTKRLNEQVKRNIKRFPPHFMFQLTEAEKDKVVANCDHLQNLKYSPYLPYVFTEHGTVMLANILNSDRAIQVSIRIVEIYIKMREYILTNKELLLKMEQLEKRVGHQDEKIVLVFNYLKRFIEVQEKPRKRVGFKPNG